ncbi:FAD binding domain-containing protein [Euzebya tangerina]|uniref:FAD binding domain-containing protein n=1 Tax=Euzebya tangerina TaxID=591198 RepID=UPI000E314DFD|nr:xanthine dehydrogenase family protein subunit M [Euzebya tangerina]
MIPAEFEYVRASSVDEAVSALGASEDAKILAGGHSLLPLMKLRLSYPETLVDIGRVDEMTGVRMDGDRVVIGAATTHYDVMTNQTVKDNCGVIAEVTGHVGDPQVRHRGTHGGSLAHGDAASDMPGMALALGAEFTIHGPGGRRTVPASEFFVDYLMTAVDEDEVLVEVSWPSLANGTRWNYQKFQHTSQGWAIVGALAVVSANGSITDAKIGLTNMGSVPVRATSVESALTGVASDDTAGIAAACASAGEGTTPPEDLHGDGAFRQHLAGVLTKRAVTAALG